MSVELDSPVLQIPIPSPRISDSMSCSLSLPPDSLGPSNLGVEKWGGLHVFCVLPATREIGGLHRRDAHRLYKIQGLELAATIGVHLARYDRGRRAEVPSSN